MQETTFGSITKALRQFTRNLTISCAAPHESFEPEPEENTANTVHTEPRVMTECDTSNPPRFGKQKSE
ncbi:MAG TPA: hypothetical protein VGV92_08330 [Gammaproteobacteria bacterium]|nr:hypothetical protein [Gammaproteobacteria bacterium]